MPEREARKLTILVAEGATPGELRAVLADNRLRWAYASRIEDTGLGWLSDLLEVSRPLGAPLSGDRPGVELEYWVEGRAFGPRLEVDWRREGQSYRLRALLEEGKSPSGVTWSNPPGEVLTAIGGERCILLHGTLDEKSPRERLTWSEARVPRRLAHPYEPAADKPPAKRVALLGQDYGHDGMVVLIRLTGIVPIEGQG
jgi:hypothetical protein